MKRKNDAIHSIQLESTAYWTCTHITTDPYGGPEERLSKTPKIQDFHILFNDIQEIVLLIISYFNSVQVVFWNVEWMLFQQSPFSHETKRKSFINQYAVFSWHTCCYSSFTKMLQFIKCTFGIITGIKLVSQSVRFLIISKQVLNRSLFVVC